MIGAIEDAIIDRLDTLNEAGVLGYRLRQIKTYGGELRSKKARAEIKDFPAVWLAFSKATTVQETNSYAKLRGQWAFLLATENLRNEKAARHGAAGDVGAYQIAVDLVSIFAGKKPGDLEGVEAIKDIKIDPVSVDDSRNGRLAVYAIPFSCDFQIQKTSPELDLTNPLEIIHTNWDLPPVGGVGSELPDDKNADATSHVTGD